VETKKEDEVRATVGEALKALETLRTNDLHHVQLSVDRLEVPQGETTEAMVDMKEAIVQSVNQSQTAIRPSSRIGSKPGSLVEAI
jgi:hypothetical protein